MISSIPCIWKCKFNLFCDSVDFCRLGTMHVISGFSQHSGYSRIEDETCQEIVCEENITCYGYKSSWFKKICFHVFSFLLAGIPYLLVHWNCQYSAYMKNKRCSLEEAELLLIKDSYGQYSIQQIKTSIFRWPGSGEVNQVRYFHHHLLKFVWSNDIGGFTRVLGLDNGNTRLSQLHDNTHGFTAEEQTQLLEVYGENVIVIDVKSYWALFIEEVFNPFYIFQAFSVILWSLDEYYIYAGCIVFLSAVSVITSLIQTRKQSIALRDLVAASNSSSVSVLRRGAVVEQVNASSLVPGDVIVIPPRGCIMSCDAVLLNGNCIVNESMLTGESVPVTKTPPAHTEESYNPVEHKRHTLFSGTQVIQTRFYESDKVLAVVVRTGFSTAKGELVQSILYPKPMSGFKFYRDSMRFVTFLFFIAALGMGYCVYLYIRRHASIETILLRTLDIITIVVPPALPAAMTAGTVYAQNRLQKLGIFCISPPRINVSGKVKLVCFDKTGTLTEEGLDLWGVLPLQDLKFYSEPVRDPTTLPVESPFLAVMATCHSLTVIEGELSGDPLDVKMFEATKWELEEPGEDTKRYDMLLPTVVKPPPHLTERKDLKQFEDDFGAGDDEIPFEIGIVRQFPFGSAAQCMSVIARTLGSTHMTLYAKGAPEKIKSLCDQKTVPENFDALLMQYTLSGYRVIALAYKNLEPKFSWKQAQRVNREQLECDMEFLGLLIMQNTLKPETSPAISQLHLAKIRCVMVTGDNILTAVSVARDCGMVTPFEHVIQLSVQGDPQQGTIHRELIGVPQAVHHANLTPSAEVVLPLMPNSRWHFAVDGRTWAALRSYHPELLPQVVTKGTIFARMAPDQKTQLVETLQGLDYIVAMCGDGANDCGALKAAHIGISLSEAEASVAAPFTSRVANITCVLKLIQEGRCALVTSFGIFKYMALYSIIQFVTILILYTRASILGNMQFLYIDLVITTSIAVLMGRTGPTSRLVSKRPMGSLVSANNIIPLLMQVLLTVAVQLATMYFLIHQEWFEPIKMIHGKEETVVCWENTSLFCVSCYQYMILAVVYSKGRPHRKPFYTNILFLLTLVVLTTFTTFLVVYPVQPLAHFFELMPVSEKPEFLHFRLWLLAFPAIHLLASVFIETCIADTRWFKSLLHCMARKKVPKNRYKLIDRDMSINSTWLQEINT